MKLLVKIQKKVGAMVAGVYGLQEACTVPVRPKAS
jgi:hypothetical protein